MVGEIVGFVLGCSRHVHVGGFQARHEGVIGVSDSGLGKPTMKMPREEWTVDDVVDL